MYIALSGVRGGIFSKIDAPPIIVKSKPAKELYMKKIPLSQNQIAIVDDDDYEKINKYKWTADLDKRCNKFRARRNIYKKGKNIKSILMHRFIMNCPENMTVDHINHDTLDNRKSNLRICTLQQNCGNQGPRKGTSKYKGVSWYKQIKKWTAQISYKFKKIRLGYFKTEKEAAQAYNEAAKKYHGKFAYLNEV